VPDVEYVPYELICTQVIEIEKL